MKQQIQKYIYSVIALVGFSFLLGNFVSAQTSDILVNFNPDPLFSETNFLPGQTSNSIVGLENVGSSDRAVTVKAINVNDPNDFGDVLYLRIDDGNQTFFDGTLADFFDQGSLSLGDLVVGESIDYNFTVNFLESGDNQYQEESLGFDLEFNFIDNEEGGEPPIIVYSLAGGGYYNPGTTELLIFNEEALVQSTDTTLINWDTNQPATTRVVYSSADQPHVFDYNNSTDYGYSISTNEESALITDHQVTLNNLSENTLYYYRVISHRQNEEDTVSPEHSFKMAAVAGEKIIAEDSPLVVGQPLVKGIKDIFSGVKDQEESSSSVEQMDIVTVNNKIKSGTFLQCQIFPWWPLVSIIILSIILIILNFKDNSNNKNRLVYSAFLAVLPLLPWWICHNWSSGIWIIVILIYVVILLFYILRKADNHYKWLNLLLLVIFIMISIILLASCFC